MIEITTTIINRLGLHARAASLLVNCASEFQSEIWLKVDERRVNGKSIMGVLTLAASQGTAITIQAEGDDEAEAANAVKQLIDRRFNEDE